ncbi:MAG: alanine--tRNA ligase [Verrucomicrobia bacterium]|nr:alanine--tRNA ligase [Verrucomicrobiota bacterium]
MTSAQIRQSFLDFFARHGHSIVPSASLMPTAPNLLFTNAGMNQFVPYFLGEQAAPWKRVADTQKCIRAGGKHNDLEDVGYDTYHHTMFEMLGNWSFGDYFKRESLTWGWELITKVWGIPPKRLFATVYAPDKAKGDPSEFDQEAYDIWAGLFRAAGLDPQVHIVNGNRKDNFWMMGDTGPCGPCSEIHFNLMPSDDEQAGRRLVNSSSPRCIEIWNHVFIQYNANADGTFSPLAAKHVDTGMGFERVAGIHASSKGFTDFTAEPSNYAADVFAPLFAKVAALSGQTYHGTVPTKREGLSEQERIDVAFRVLADHARTISCAIADNILPGNEGRNYVIRRILRRGILYGRKLGLPVGFFEQLVTPVVESLGEVFPELKDRQETIRRVIRSEEESFGRTLDKGLAQFESALDQLKGQKIFPGAQAFLLYDTYGFPLDMTQLLAAERGLTVDTTGFDALMQQQRDRARAAQKKEVIVAATEDSADAKLSPTVFVGYMLTPTTAVHATLTDVVKTEKATFLVFDQTPFYAELGGQAGDAGHALVGGHSIAIVDCVKDKAGRHLHKVAADAKLPALTPGSEATLAVDFARRRAISRHHSAAHLIHWALRKTLGTHVRQAGTSKTPDRMRFDFSHFEAVTPAQLAEVERLVNEKVIDNSPVQAYETEFDKKPADTLAFFGDKYGKIVRVVDIGGFSRELCGGTHVATTGEIGLVKITAEMAIAAGTRRIEAVAGQAAYDFVAHEEAALKAVNTRLNAGPQDVAQKLDALITYQKELEKKLKAFESKAAAGLADELAAGAKVRDGLKWVSAVVSADNQDALRSLGSQVVNKVGPGAVVQLGTLLDGKVALVAYCSPEAIKAGLAAGKLIAALAGKLGGKGGGKPDYAQGGGGDASKLADALRL